MPNSAPNCDRHSSSAQGRHATSRRWNTVSDDSKQPERGVFAKRVKDLGSEVHDVRIVLTLVANAMARAGHLRLDEVRRIDKLLNADDGKEVA